MTLGTWKCQDLKRNSLFSSDLKSMSTLNQILNVNNKVTIHISLLQANQALKLLKQSQKEELEVNTTNSVLLQTLELPTENINDYEESTAGRDDELESSTVASVEDLNESTVTSAKRLPR